MSEKTARAARQAAAAPSKAYALRPTRGQALLAYPNRTAPAPMPVYDADLTEAVRPDPGAQWRDKIIQGDCLSACAWMRENGLAADLVYIDPPFASGANYAKKLILRQAGAAVLKNGAQPLGEEVMYGDIWQKEDYLNWIYERLLAVREVMAERASIYVHLDWHIGHYVKILMDEVFGEENFRNEIVWFYHDTPGRGDNCFPRKHDTLFYYAKGDDPVFNPDAVRVEILPRSRERYKTPRKLGGREYVGGAASEKGKIPEDVWTIPVVKGNSDEYREYATQKPEALLKRVILASSNPGDIVADFFCGSGTTLSAARRLGRRFIGCDIGVNAVQTTRDRLRKAGAAFDIWRIRDGVRLFRNPAQTTARLFALLPGWQSRERLGLGEFWDGGVAEKGGAFTPVKFVGIQGLLTRQMVTAVLEGAADLGDAGKDAASARILYAHKAADVDQAWADAAARRHRRSDVRIRLQSLDELLTERGGDFYPADSAEVARTRTAAGWRARIRMFCSPYLKGRLEEHNARLLAGNRAAQPLRAGERGLEWVESVQFSFGDAAEAWRSDLEDCPAAGQTVAGEYEVPADNFRMKIRSIAGDELIVPLAEMAEESPAARAKGARKTAAKKKRPAKKGGR